jgi:hypothetical protein
MSRERNTAESQRQLKKPFDSNKIPPKFRPGAGTPAPFTLWTPFGLLPRFAIDIAYKTL